MTERLIVIGGGGAGISAATTAKRVDPDLKVSLFTEFEDIAYSPCGIPFVHGGEIPRFEDLFLSTVERYVSDGLDMNMETVITDIDLDRGVVTARNQHIGFDKLIVATGFLWEKPDVPGANLEGLHYVKNIRKAMEFDKLLDSIKTVAVVGATPLGVEMAGNLGHRGLEVHFIDEGPWVLHEVLDPDVAEPVHQSLVDRGVTLHLGTAVEGFVGDGHVRAVQTSAGEIACDVVIVCLHKMPNTALAQAAGLQAGTTGGLIVDDHMRTPRDGVWAGGDVIEVPHGLTMIPIRGLTGSHAYSQGRTAGANAAGDDRTYDPVWVPWGLVAGDYTIGGFSLGETLATAMGVPYVLAKGVGVSRARYFPGATKTHVKLLAEPGTLRLIGGQIHGGEGVKERCDFLAFAAKRGATLDDLAWMENIYSPPIGALFEPIAIAAQNGLADLRKKAARRRSPARTRRRRRSRHERRCRPGCRGRSSALREQAELHLRLAAMDDLRRDHPGVTSAPHRPSGGAFWRYVFVPLYRRLPWATKERAMHALEMTAEAPRLDAARAQSRASRGGRPPRRRPDAASPTGARRHSTIFQKESLRLILPSVNSKRSQPRTSMRSPVAWVPRIVHSETPRSPQVQWRSSP